MLTSRSAYDFAALARLFSEGLTPARAERLSVQLGVSVAALLSTGAGWCGRRHAWSWPMHDHDSRIVGIRLRDARTHRKYAVTGSKQGVFLAGSPDHLDPAQRVVITEGATDLCAALDLGFTAIGRPSCNGGTRHVVSLTRGLEVAIVADTDEPGRRGAQSLAAALLPTVRGVRIIEPPHPIKDLRGWLHAGATSEDVESCIEAANIQTVRVRIRR